MKNVQQYLKSLILVGGDITRRVCRKVRPLSSVGAVLLVALSTYAASDETSTEPLTEETIQKSVFQDEAGIGKDPFFPNSTRRAPKVPTISAPTAVPIVELSLKGISGSAERRLALINNRTFAVGETAAVRVSGGSVNVRCWEINENSVVVSVEGDPERKELRLRENL